MSQKNLSRRDFLQMGALTAAGATLAACGAAPTPQVVEKVVTKEVEVEKVVTKEVEKQVTVKETVVVQATAAPAEVVEITFMGWGDVAEDEGVRSAITVFQGAEPDIKVTWLHTPDNYIEKMLSMVAAGTPPDTAFVNNQTFLTYVHEKMLLDITDMLKADKVVGAPGYFIEPQETNRCTYQAKWYGIGACWTGSHVYYNADIFDKAGVKPPSNNLDEAWKWDDFLTVAKQLTVDAKGKHPGESGFDANNIDRWGVYWDVWWMHLLAAIKSNEGEFVDPKTQLLALDQPAAAEALQAIADLRLVHQVSPSAAVFDQLGMSNTQMLENGKLAMAVDGSWALSYMCKIQATLGTAVLPKLKVAATGLQSHLHSAFVGTKHPQEAWRWLRFLATEYYQLQFLRMGLWLPSQTALMTEEGLKKWIIPRKSATEGVHPAGYDLIASQYVPKCGNILYQPAGYQKASAIFTPALDAIWIGDKTAAQAMAEVVPQANDVLKQEAAS
jgi:multiple sugar transport system substrate-binding protein